MRTSWPALVAVACLGSAAARAADPPGAWPAPIHVVLDTTAPLVHGRDGRLPLYLWPALDPGLLEAERAEALVAELDRRGVGLVCRWDWGDRDRSLAAALVVARAQHGRGLLVNVDATSCLSSFFDGDPRTAHVDDEGGLFWDSSFGPPHMGCPFALAGRRGPIRERIEFFADAYSRAGLAPGFVFADWEIDGPIEWNGAWDASRRCRRCRAEVPDIDNFLAFQKRLRDLRADLERDVYAEPLRRRYPGVLVGNYAVHPHDGFRYWYDFFEREPTDAPGLRDGRTLHRHWASEFEGSGFTCAMPVVYTWERIWGWSDHLPADFRWFRALLMEATSVGRQTPRDVPIVSFVHWHTTAPADPRDPAVEQMSAVAYRELLWHMLLRGTDTFFLWCLPEEQAEEIALLHPVWAAAQEYGAFLDRGTPVCFDVPSRCAPVVSGLRLGDRVLVRRTDFGPTDGPVDLIVEGRRLRIDPAPGRCRILSLADGR